MIPRREYDRPDRREERIKVLEAELVEAREAIRDLLAFADTSWLTPRMQVRVLRAAGLTTPPDTCAFNRMPTRIGKQKGD